MLDLVLERVWSGSAGFDSINTTAAMFFSFSLADPSQQQAWLAQESGPSYQLFASVLPEDDVRWIAEALPSNEARALCGHGAVFGNVASWVHLPSSCKTKWDFVSDDRVTHIFFGGLKGNDYLPDRNNFLRCPQWVFLKIIIQKQGHAFRVRNTRLEWVV